MTEQPTPRPDVKGRCPACGWTSLFLGSGGYVTCSRIDCPEPDAASSVLEREEHHARTTADNPVASDDEADNPLHARYSAAIDEGFRTFDADQTDGYLIDHITDAVLACRNADLAALRVWLSTEAAHCRRNADAANVEEAAQALGGMAAGCELAVRVIDGMAAGKGLPVSGGVKPEAGVGG